MNPKEYQIASRKTWRRIGVNSSAIDVYCLLGLSDEAGELLEKLVNTKSTKEDIINEAGDVLWYLTQLISGFHFRPDEVIKGSPEPKPNIDSAQHLVIAVGKLTGVVKKTFRDGDGAIKEYDIILDHLTQCYYWLEVTCLMCGFTVEDAMIANIAKLSSRLERGVIGGSGDHR